MGYVSRDIAVITEPGIVTLSGVPNFVQFASKPSTKTYTILDIMINDGITPDNSHISITDATGVVHNYRGTDNVDDVDGSTFYISGDISDTAENFRQVLLSNNWFRAHFRVVIPFVWDGTTPRNGSVLSIKSKGAGTDFNITVDAPDDNAYTVAWISQTSLDNDSISGEAPTAEIELDIYVNHGVPLGRDDRPINPDELGTYVTSLQKTYAGVPVWFDLNALFARYGGYNLPPDAPGWFDVGTAQAYRFLAKIKGANSFYFYQSNALYALNGHGSVGDSLAPYIYADNTIRLLTNKPRTPYIRGQKEYLNFIYSEHPVYYTLRVAYRAYSTSETYLGTVYGHEKAHTGFAVVNTCVLDIDAVLDKYPTAGVIRVALVRDTDVVSNDLEYTVRPDHLHTLRQFSFLNRLGGWDAFNFDAGVKDEIKPSVETYDKALTPSYNKGDSAEMVYNTVLADTYTIEGAPVTDEVAVWLKELAASRVILDGDGNYIILEDFTLQITDADKNMQKPIIKYHYDRALYK